MKPYFQENGIVIYNADCREILPSLVAVDLVLTDPPYPDFNSDHGKNWDYVDIKSLELPDVRQFLFWPVLRDFPLDFTATHVWHKPNGQSNEHYERVFERNGQKVCRVWRESAINSLVAAQMSGDVFTDHPTQKPIRLLRKILLLTDEQVVLDPFMGSGTTLRAAKDLGRKAIGIEIEERYCEIAANRLRQEVLQFEVAV